MKTFTQIGPKTPWRRKSGGRKHGDDHPQYGPIVRWMKSYEGNDSFIRSCKHWFLTKDLSYKQVKALGVIMERGVK